MRKFFIIAPVVLAMLVIALLALLPGSPVQAPLFGNVTIIKRLPIETQRPNPGIIKVAHRGTTIYAPENTLPALEKAIELGFDYVEMDVRFSSDGVPVLIHDATVDRTTDGSGEVSEFTLSELKELDAGFWFGDEFAGTRIPTLEEALKLLQGRICIFWDTKARPDKAAIELFQNYGFERNCMLVTFGGLGSGGPEIPRQIVEFWPDAPLAPTVRNQAEIAEILSDFPNIRAVTLPRTKLSPEVIDAAHAEGLLVVTSSLGQADRAVVYEKIIEAGVDMLMLDHIDSFYTYLETGNIDTPMPEVPKNAGDFSY